MRTSVLLESMKSRGTVPAPEPRPPAPQWSSAHIASVESTTGPAWGPKWAAKVRVADPWHDEHDVALCGACERDHGQLYSQRPVLIAGKVVQQTHARECPSCAPMRRLARKLPYTGMPVRLVRALVGFEDDGRPSPDPRAIWRAVEAAGAVLLGAPRGGKTMTAARIAWRWLLAGDQVMWVEWEAYLQKQVGSDPAPLPRFGPDGDRRALLVLDDVGETRPSEWKSQQIKQVLDDQHPDTRLIVTSNLTNELEAHIGPRAFGRLAEYTNGAQFEWAP